MSKRNKILLALSLVAVLPISGCSLFLSNLSDKTIGVYSLLGDVESGKSIENYSVGNFVFKTQSTEELIPYVSLETYANMVKPHLLDGFESEVFDAYENGSWYVKDPDGDYVFAVETFPKDKTIYRGGSLSGAIKEGKDYSKSSLMVRMDVDADAIRGQEKDGSAYYGNTSYKVYRRNSETYYPLSLLDSAFGSETGIYHLYNYNRIIQFDEYEKLTEFKYLINNQEMTVFSEMKSYINSFLQTMPSYLMEDRANAFLYIMDNYYGLAYTRRIGSMARYYKQQSYYDYFFSNDDDKRNEAFYAAVGLLDDGHSAVSEDSSAPWYTKAFGYGGSHLQEMINVRNNLTSTRGSFYSNLNKQVGDVLYSTSGKLAFFSFDSFSFDENAYNGNNLKPDLYLTDTFFYFIHAFEEIKAHGGVETIVIDVSINGGGVVGIMMKLLALLSKDNEAPMYFMEDTTLMVEKDVISVDSNGDNHYDETDCYGNDFNFAFLTSGYSFSCGNALPFYASKNGYAKVIGQTSAGGECAVAESYLPSGEHFYHSSNLHLGYFDEKSRIWEGDEGGAPVNYVIDYANFYNLDYLDQLLN